MEYQKTIHLLDITTNQPFKFRSKNWGLELLMIRVELITHITNSNSTLRCKSQSHAMTVKHIYL